jgi:hypothetical protein
MHGSYQFALNYTNELNFYKRYNNYGFILFLSKYQNFLRVVSYVIVSIHNIMLLADEDIIS